IERLGQIEPIVDPVCFIDRLVEVDALPPRRRHGDEGDDQQAERGERWKEPDQHRAARSELHRRDPPLIEANGRKPQRLELVDKRTMARCVEQLMVPRKHEERPHRDAVEGERDISPPAPLNSRSIKGAVPYGAPPIRDRSPFRNGSAEGRRPHPGPRSAIGRSRPVQITSSMMWTGSLIAFSIRSNGSIDAGAATTALAAFCLLVTVQPPPMTSAASRAALQTHKIFCIGPS